MKKYQKPLTFHTPRVSRNLRKYVNRRDSRLLGWRYLHHLHRRFRYYHKY